LLIFMEIAMNLKSKRLILPALLSAIIASAYTTTLAQAPADTGKSPTAAAGSSSGTVPELKSPPGTDTAGGTGTAGTSGATGAADTTTGTSGTSGSTGGTDTNTGTTSGATAGGTTTVPVPVTVPLTVLMPVEVQKDPQLNNGCWVRLASNAGQGTTGATGTSGASGTSMSSAATASSSAKAANELTVAGQLNLPNFSIPSGVNWAQKTDSLVVGPNATVIVFGEPQYRGNSATLKAGQEVKDVRKELGFMQSIGSMQVNCST
jgi:hypothetical protein